MPTPIPATPIHELLGDRLLVRLDVGTQITPAGLVIPPSAQELQQFGEVLKLGPDAVGHGIDVGATVLVDLHAGTVLHDSSCGREVIYRLADIQAVLEADRA